MEQKNRLLIALAVIVLIAGALLASFGRSLFGSDRPAIVLPSVETPEASSGGSSSVQGQGQYMPVSVTPATVQDVIATLVRTSSCSRDLTVETYWNGGSRSASVRFWTDGGWTLTEQTLPSGDVRHDITGEGTLYYWYTGYDTYRTMPADGQTSDLTQGIPTYETVLSIPAESIVDASYQTLEDISCIYAKVQAEGSPRTERFWVSVDSGLLVCAEAEESGTLVYRMTAFGPVTTPCPADASFTLPDGTVLHTVQS